MKTMVNDLEHLDKLVGGAPTLAQFLAGAAADPKFAALTLRIGVLKALLPKPVDHFEDTIKPKIGQAKHPPIPDGMHHHSVAFCKVCFNPDPIKRSSAMELLSNPYLLCEPHFGFSLPKIDKQLTRAVPSDQVGFLQDPTDQSLLCDGVRVGQIYQDLEDAVEARHPCILYSSATIAKNYDNLETSVVPPDPPFSDVTFERSYVFSLSHCSCPDVVGTIYDYINSSSQTQVQFELHTPHHFDIIRAVLPQSTWSKCVVDGTSRLPQSKIEQAVQSNMIFKVYNVIDVANLANAAHQGNLSYKVQVLLPTDAAEETLEAINQDGTDPARLSEKLFTGSSEGSECFQVRGVHYVDKQQSLNQSVDAMLEANAVLASRGLGRTLGKEKYPIMYFTHLKTAQDAKELFVKLCDENLKPNNAMLDVTEILMSKSTALLAPIRACEAKERPEAVKTRSASEKKQEYKLTSEFVAPSISDVFMVHGTIERKANKKCPGNGTSKLNAATFECAKLCTMIARSNTPSVHPSFIAAEAQEVLIERVDNTPSAVELGIQYEVADYTELCKKLPNAVEERFRPIIEGLKSKLGHSDSCPQFNAQVQRTLIAIFDVQLLAHKMKSPNDTDLIECSLHMPMSEDPCFRKTDMMPRDSPPEPMELIAQIYNGRHGMLYDMVHANEAIEYILDMDDCMWRRCLTIKPLTASEFGRSTMSSSIKAIVQGTDVVRNNIRYLGQNYRIRHHGAEEGFTLVR